MKLGIILGSVREGRKGQDVADFVMEVLGSRETGAEYDLIDLKDFDLPVLSSGTHPMAAKKQYEDERVTRWSSAIDACDGFLFLTAEYNHGVPGALKNAVDTLGPEWVGKPVGFIAYGSVGGVRAVEQWRQIMANFSSPMARAEVNLNVFTDWTEDGFHPAERRRDSVAEVADAVEDLITRSTS